MSKFSGPPPVGDLPDFAKIDAARAAQLGAGFIDDERIRLDISEVFGFMNKTAGLDEQFQFQLTSVAIDIAYCPEWT